MTLAADREKLIRGLQNRINESRNHGGIAVPVALSTLSGALVLLKEQEPVEPKIRTSKTSILFEEDCEISVAYCGCCGFAIDQPTEGGRGWKYCPECGREVKWDG